MNSEEQQENIDEFDNEDFAAMNGISSNSRPSNTTSYQEAAPEEFITRRNTWQQPWPKAVLVGSAILAVVAALGSMLHGTTEAFNGTVTSKKNSSSSAASSQTPKTDPNSNTEGDKDAKIALTTQLNELRNQKSQTDSTPIAPPTPTPSVENPLPVRAHSRTISYDPPQERVYHPVPRPTYQPPVPRKIAVYHPPPPPVPLRRAAPLAQSTSSLIDPTQAWTDAGNAGTWGTIASASVPNGSKSLDMPIGGPTSPPAILDNKSVDKQTEVNASSSNDLNVRAGTRVKGVFLVPLSWAGSNGSSSSIEQVASIELREDLLDKYGAKVLPFGSIIIAKITRATSTGIVTMIATSAQTPHGDDKSLPENVVSILGKNGGVLRARVELPANGRNSLGTAIYAGINKGAEVLNRPTSGLSSSYTGYGGGAQSFSFNSKNNVLAGVAEGVAGAMLEQGMQRQQQRMQSRGFQEPTYSIKQGTNVEIRVNQSFSL